MWRALSGRDTPAGPAVAIDGPLVGVKYGAVVAVDGDLRFCGTTARSRHPRCYDTEAEATCQQGQDHRPPAWACTCGFYAHATDQQLEHSWGELRRPYWARLVVELSGRVVEHDRGWRASRQVVLEASWEDRCETCSAPHADGFGPSHRVPGAVVPRCRRCAGDRWLSISEVAGRLGTDVRLVPAAATPAAGPPAVPARGSTWRRQLATRGAVLVLIATVATALVALGGGPSAAPSPSDLVEELRPHVDLWDPATTARQLAVHLDGNGRRAVVLADDGAPAVPGATSTGASAADATRSTALIDVGAVVDLAASSADERARQPVVAAIAVFRPPEDASSAGPQPAPSCDIVLVRPGLPSGSWAVVPTPATSLDACVADAMRARAVHPVEPGGPAPTSAPNPTATSITSPDRG